MLCSLVRCIWAKHSQLKFASVDQGWNAMGQARPSLPSIVASLLQSTGVVSVYVFVGICMVVFAVIIGICGIETRNKTLEEINDEVVSK